MSKSDKVFAVWQEEASEHVVRQWYRGFHYWTPNSTDARLFNERGAQRILTRLNKHNKTPERSGFICIESMQAAGYSIPEQEPQA